MVEVAILFKTLLRFSIKIFSKIKGSWGGLKLMASHYGEIYRNTSLVKMGLNRAQKYNKDVKIILEVEPLVFSMNN